MQRDECLRADPRDHSKDIDCIRKFLRTFKTQESLTCINFHLGQRRRNPYDGHSFLYYPNEVCNCDEIKCQHCHSVLQHRFHPLIYKTQKCAQYQNCKNGFFCPALHAFDWPIVEKNQFFRFDIKLFKTQPCFRKENHEKKTCLYYHNERDRRRSNFQCYSHITCNVRECKNKDNCEQAHNKIQQLYHPSRYKSKFCQAYPHRIFTCEYGDFCSFAHTQHSIAIKLIDAENKDPQYIVNNFKTVWCPHTNKHDRSICPYAHNMQDFRRRPYDFDYSVEKCENWNFSDQIKSIEEAGCENGMQCSKCHGWMEQRYHPDTYLKKKSKKVSKNNYKEKQIKCENENPKKWYLSVGAPFYKHQKERQDNVSDNDMKYEEERKIWTPWNYSSRQQTRRSKSQGNSQQYSVHYSLSLKSVFAGEEQLVSELEKQRINQAKLINIYKNEGEHLKLSEQNRSKLLRKLKEYYLKKPDMPICYSNSILKMFMTFECLTVLEKLQKHKIKESSLLKFKSKDIKELTCLDETEKKCLLKALKQYKNDREFNPIQDAVNQVIKCNQNKAL